MTFEVNDTVRVNWPDHPTHGRLGVVTRVAYRLPGARACCFAVELDGEDGERIYYAHHLILAISADVNPAEFVTATGALR